MCIIEHLNVASCILGADLNVLRWNEHCVLRFGWTQHEVMGRFCPVVPAETHEFLRHRLVDMQQNDRVSFVTPLLHKSGFRYNGVILCRAVSADTGRFVLCFRVHDQAPGRLLDSRPIVHVSAGRLQHVSRAFAEMLGVKAGDVVRASFTDFLHSSCVTIWESFVHTPARQSIYCILQGYDGSQVYVQLCRTIAPEQYVVSVKVWLTDRADMALLVFYADPQLVKHYIKQHTAVAYAVISEDGNVGLSPSLCMMLQCAPSCRYDVFFTPAEHD